MKERPCCSAHMQSGIALGEVIKHPFSTARGVSSGTNASPCWLHFLATIKKHTVHNSRGMNTFTSDSPPSGQQHIRFPVGVNSTESSCDPQDSDLTSVWNILCVKVRFCGERVRLCVLYIYIPFIVSELVSVVICRNNIHQQNVFSFGV